MIIEGLIIFSLIMIITWQCDRDFGYEPEYQIMHVNERFCIDEHYDRKTGHWVYIYNDGATETVSKARKVV